MKIITLKLEDSIYDALMKRTKEEGFPTVTEYITSLILRSIEKTKDVKIDREESKKTISLDRILALIERKVQDNINPFTQKIDDINRKIALIIEQIENLEEHINSLEEKIKILEALHAESKEQKKEKKIKKTAIDILKDQKIMFERDIVNKIKDRDSFFARLEREGAIVIEAKDERIAIDSQFWQSFLQKLKNIKTNNDEELKKILDPPELRLLQKLRESALLIFDVSSKNWNLLL